MSIELRFIAHSVNKQLLLGSGKQRKLHAFTTHVRLEHDFVVYPSTRGYTYQQLIGGRQAHAAQQWVQSDIAHQERTD